MEYAATGPLANASSAAEEGSKWMTIHRHSFSGRWLTCNVLALCQLEHVFDAVNDLEAAGWCQLSHISRVEVAIRICMHMLHEALNSTRGGYSNRISTESMEHRRNTDKADLQTQSVSFPWFRHLR